MARTHLAPSHHASQFSCLFCCHWKCPSTSRLKTYSVSFPKRRRSSAPTLTFFFFFVPLALIFLITGNYSIFSGSSSSFLLSGFPSSSSFSSSSSPQISCDKCYQDGGCLLLAAKTAVSHRSSVVILSLPKPATPRLGDRHPRYVQN